MLAVRCIYIQMMPLKTSCFLCDGTLKGPAQTWKSPWQEWDPPPRWRSERGAEPYRPLAPCVETIGLSIHQAEQWWWKLKHRLSYCITGIQCLTFVRECDSHTQYIQWLLGYHIMRSSTLFFSFSFFNSAAWKWKTWWGINVAAVTQEIEWVL